MSLIAIPSGALRSALAALLAAALPLTLSPSARAAEVELKSLEDGESQEKKYGPYVGVFGGATSSQSADMTLDYTTYTLDYDVLATDGSFVLGFEVGYSWKTKFFIELGLEFEGFFSSTEVSALLSNNNAGAPITLGDVATAKADMNYAAFMLNGTLTLDLSKLKPRIGGWLPRLRPYVGGGIGGAQIWFRNQVVQSVGDVIAVPTPASIDTFSTDEFVFASQIFGGLEIKISDKVAVYGEYRKLMLEKAGDLDDFETEMLLGGIHIRY